MKARSHVNKGVFEVSLMSCKHLQIKSVNIRFFNLVYSFVLLISKPLCKLSRKGSQMNENNRKQSSESFDFDRLSFVIRDKDIDNPFLCPCIVFIEER